MRVLMPQGVLEWWSTGVLPGVGAFTAIHVANRPAPQRSVLLRS